MIQVENIKAYQGTIQLHNRINLDSAIQAPCQALTLIIQDIMGSYLQNVQHTILKTHIRRRKVKENINLNSCYGAELLRDQKCYNCQKFMMAFVQRRWRQSNIESIVQFIDQPTNQFDDSELNSFYKLIILITQKNFN